MGRVESSRVGCGILLLPFSENGSDAVLSTAGTGRNGYTKLDPCSTLALNVARTSHRVRKRMQGRTYCWCGRCSRLPPADPTPPPSRGEARLPRSQQRSGAWLSCTQIIHTHFSTRTKANVRQGHVRWILVVCCVLFSLHTTIYFQPIRSTSFSKTLCQQFTTRLKQRAVQQRTRNNNNKWHVKNAQHSLRT